MVTTLYCTVTYYQYYVGLLCIAFMWYHFALFTSPVPMWDHVCIVSVPMWDHFALHCLPHQYLCGTTLYCISTYVGPLCMSVPMWDHFVLYQYGTSLYCTVYLISTYMRSLCIVGIYLISRPTYMCDHFVLHCDCLPHQYLCGTYCISTYVGPLCTVTMWDHFVLHCLPYQYLYEITLYCNSRYIPHQ